VLSDRPEEYVEIAAFQVGAEDYLLKPIHIQAFIKRIEALRRREKAKQTKQIIRISSTFFIDPKQYLIEKED